MINRVKHTLSFKEHSQIENYRKKKHLPSTKKKQLYNVFFLRHEVYGSHEEIRFACLFHIKDETAEGWMPLSIVFVDIGCDHL